MLSSVFFKFKSQKEPSRVEFEGTGISVFELKREIIIKSGLGDGSDFDLAIFNEDEGEEYDDDTAIIPRSTTVIARRLPATKKGAGRAARYMTGKMPINAKNSSRKEHGKPAAKPAASAMGQMNNAMSEEDRLQAMFQAQSEQWEQTKEEMARQTKVHVTYNNNNKKNSDNEPPVGYVCYRCGETGHYIKECPTNDDPNYESKPRLKRTTGIPRSFLKTVEKPNLLRGDGTEDTKLPAGIMVNAEGQFVVAEPDKKSWEQFQAKTKSSAAALKAAEEGDVILKDRGLECPIDKKIFLDPMKTPCCEKTYCSECITNALIENDLVCPNCQTEGVLMDNLIEDHETAKKITEYLDEKKVAAKERSKSPSVKPESPAPAVAVAAAVTEKSKSKSKSKSPTPNIKSEIKTPPKSTRTPVPENTSVAVKPNSSTTAGTAPKSKKRPADELLENPKIPKGPKAMQQQAAQKQVMLQQQQQQQMMNGFPNMPPFNPMQMPNQFFPNNGFQGMPNMNMNMNMMNGGWGMMGMNPMMNPMMGFPNMGFSGGNGGFGMGNGMGGGGMNNGGGNGGGGAGNGFPNQQKTVFAEPLPNEEDNAYFRKPVNPHRHQGRAKRVRPSDFKEL